MNIICDSSFWLSLYDKNDEEFHKKAINIAEKFEFVSGVYMPWPSMYLLINTKFLKEKYDPFLKDFRRRIRERKIIKIDDLSYKKNAYARLKKNGASLVDCIVDEIYLDKKINIDCVVSFTNKRYIHHLTLL